MSATKDIPIELATAVADAFDGDNVHGARVRAIAAVLAELPSMTSRALVRWTFDVTGRRLSQSTVSRAQTVASALVTARFPFGALDDAQRVTDEMAAKLIVDGLLSAEDDASLKWATATLKDGTRAIADLVRIRTLANAERMAAVASTWDPDTYTLSTFADYVADSYATDDAARIARDANAAAKRKESRKLPAVDGGVDGGSGSGQDMAGEKVGGGETARITAGKESAALRALAGQITTGQVAVTDELITAARAVLTAIADRAELETHVTAEPAVA